MLEESETLAMFSLFLAAAETLEQQEAISPSTRQFEEVCIDKLQSGISTAYAESGNLDPLSTTTTNGFEQVFLQQANENVSVACDMTDPLFATNLNERSFHNHHEHRSDVGNLAGDHSASIRHNAIENLPAILSNQYVDKISKSMKRNARSASTSEYSAYRNLSSSNNISQNPISNTTVPGVLLNNREEISKSPSFLHLAKVQTNACRGNSNLQNQSDEPWSSQAHPHANRVACKDVSHSSTTHKQVQLPNHYAQYGGPWENLSNPGANRVALADISNHSTTYKRGRLLSARDICGDHSASIRHNAIDKLPAILSIRYVEKSKSTKRHARSASTSEYSAYRNLSSFNNISQNRISNTTVPGVLLNNQKEISKRPSFCLDNVQTNACRGNSNLQNQSDEPWSSQPHPHANRVACKDVSHSSTTHKQVQLPNHYAQYGGPWENLSNPGANRVALADISNHSTTYKRGRLLSARDICGDHSASIRHNANDKLPAILSNRYVEKSESTKRHARSASTSEYSAYRNLSSFNNISQNRISNTTVPGVLLNNQKEISKRPSFCLDNVQTNACRGNSNHQNQSDEPWSSQPHPHANRVACKDVSHSSTTHKQVQLPNHYAQYGGPWENLSNPGANRVALADISNHSTTYKRGRLLSERDICDRSLNGMIVDEYPSFQRVQASTPISYASFALNLSLDENSTTDAPLDLVVVKPTTTISTDQIGSPMVLDLRKKNIAIDYKSPTTTRLMPEKLSLPKGHSKLTSNAISDSLGEPILNDEQMDAVDSGDYTDDDLDPEWMPDGDATLLNELSIYEYFEKYKNENLSDNDTDVENIDINVEVDSGEPQPNKKKADSRRKNQKLKEKGLSYKRADGTIVPARRVQSACNCKMRCSEKFSEPVRKELLLKLLELKQSGQNQFLSSHMSVINKLRPKVLISRRTWSRIYMLPGVGGKVKVCKHMFMSTFDIKERKIRVLADKLLLGGGIANDDKRMNNHSQKQLSPEHAEYIIKHIKSFPAEESHYGREKSSCLYLSSDLTILRMYELYQDQCGEDNLIPAHYNTYRIAFNSQNIKFRKPKIDTCNTCDMLKVELKVEKDPVKRDEILAKRVSHQAEAEAMYAEKKLDRQRANDNISVRTISFDLQKQLATPHLTCGRAFYSRQLYTYNLTIFETQTDANIPICYIWDETRGKRGSREIGSCLWNYLKALPSYVQEVVMYSDRCAGQNNNRNILFIMAYVIEMFAADGRNFVLSHKFMTSGHSHMECDTIHAAIERAKKKTTINIEIPPDWAMFIASIKRTPPIIVKEMEQKELINWLSLSQRYILPKTTTNNEPFKFKASRIFSCSTQTLGIVTFKNDVGDEQPKQICLLSAKSVPLNQIKLMPISTVPIPLPTEKVEDLRRLLPYVTKKWYYEAFLKSMNPPGRGRKPKVTSGVGFDDDMDVIEED